jgi:hypothetical protein
MFIPVIDLTTFTLDLIGFLISLIILTFFLEIVFWKAYPVIRMPYKRKTKQEPLTVETFKTFRLSAKDWLLYHLNNKLIPAIHMMPSKAISLIGDIKKRKQLNKKRKFSYYYEEEMAEDE